MAKMEQFNVVYATHLIMSSGYFLQTLHEISLRTLFHIIGCIEPVFTTKFPYLTSKLPNC